MKLGVHRDELADSLQSADTVWVLQPAELPWSLTEALGGLRDCHVTADIEEIVVGACVDRHAGDTMLVMSNGGFGGIHDKLCARLAELYGSD